MKTEKPAEVDTKLPLDEHVVVSETSRAHKHKLLKLIGLASLLIIMLVSVLVFIMTRQPRYKPVSQSDLKQHTLQSDIKNINIQLQEVDPNSVTHMVLLEGRATQYADLGDCTAAKNDLAVAASSMKSGNFSDPDTAQGYNITAQTVEKKCS